MPIHAFRGKHPHIHPTVYLADGVQIIGQVEIGEDSSIWYNSVIRGDVHAIKIGKRTNVQDLSVIHVTHDKYATTIGDDVTLAHAVRIHGATVQDRCLIGIGAILLDRVVIGHDSIVAPGAVVTEGFEAPPRSLVMGVPARLKRSLTDEEVHRIAQTAKNYVAYVAQYRERR